MKIVSPLLPESEDIKILEEIDISDIINRWASSYGLDVKTLMNNNDKLYKCLCQKSDLIFYYPFFPGNSEFYSQLQKFSWYYMNDKWEFAESIFDINKSDVVLEVGCGGGSFLKRLSKNGIECTGLELNLSAVKKCLSEGLNVIPRTLEEHVQNFKNSYDVVCSFQVLEHVSDISSFIVDQLKLLKSGGKLIISLPNESSFIQNDRSPILNMPPHHLSRWKEETLSNLPNIYNITLNRMVFEPLEAYHIDYYAGIKSQHFPYIAKGIYYRLLKFFLKFKFIRQRIKGHTVLCVFTKG